MAELSRETHAEFYSDSICTAIEGGIGYWSVCREYRWDGLAPEDIYATIQEQDEWDQVEHAKVMRIDWKTIRYGIRRILAGEVPIRRDLLAAIKEGYAEKDAGYIDADAADCIVQAALLGEIRYG